MNPTDGLNKRRQAIPAALVEALPWDAQGNLILRLDIDSDIGSGLVSREFGGMLDEHGLSHRRIKPHCSEVSGVMEQALPDARRGLGR
jgi:hypothetical protein